MKSIYTQSIVSNIRLNNALNQMEGIVALAIAFSLPLPTTKVDDYVVFYNNNCLLKVREIIACLNELQVFDVGSTIERTKLEYIRRYTGIYYPQTEACETMVTFTAESKTAFELTLETVCKALLGV